LIAPNKMQTFIRRKNTTLHLIAPNKMQTSWMYRQKGGGVGEGRKNLPPTPTTEDFASKYILSL